MGINNDDEELDKFPIHNLGFCLSGFIPTTVLMMMMVMLVAMMMMKTYPAGILICLIRSAVVEKVSEYMDWRLKSPDSFNLPD